MARIDKKFVLSTSQLNSHGFRCLTEGADLSDFIANPIMYWLHQTPEGKSADEVMPIGFWEDIKKEGDEITAFPNINDSDPFALRIGKMIEHGTLRSASIEVDPIELDTNKKNWLPGQKLPTCAIWKPGEASIVDRGSNKGAIVKLKHNGKTILLSDQATANAFFLTLQKPEENTMKITLNKKTSTALKLSEGTELDATEVVEKLVEIVETKDGEIVTLKKQANDEKITLMVTKAVDERKILAGEKEDYILLAHGNFETTKKLLDSKKGNPSIENALNNLNNGGNTEVADLVKLGFDELWKTGKLAKLKALDVNSYKLVYKAKFDKEPTD